MSESINVEVKKKLIDWDFSDPINNSKRTLINCQKSALDLEVVCLDEQNRVGEFANSRRKLKNRDVTNTASLFSCDCKSFSYAGNNGPWTSTAQKSTLTTPEPRNVLSGLKLIEGNTSVMNDKSFTLHGGLIASLSGAVKTKPSALVSLAVLTAPLREGTIEACRVKAPYQPSISVKI